MPVHRVLLGIAASTLVTGCAGRVAAQPAPVTACSAGETFMVREILYFGRNRPGGGSVSDTEWRTFLDQVITPQFPSGLTVLEGAGQWRGATGLVEQERSEIVTIFHSGDEVARRAVTEITTEYKRRFQQEAVLRENTRTCVRFE
jgi:hypothetical protein